MKRILSYMLAVVCAISGTTALSKNIDLLAEPKADSKVTGKVNTEKPVTIVYTPKSGEWIKVANPENGDVGWIKSKEIAANAFTMQVMTSDDGSHSYSIYQSGNTNRQYDQQQITKEMQMLVQQQYMAQIHMASLFNDMFNLPFHTPGPIIVPVIMQPEQPQQKKSADNSVKQAKTT